MRLLTVIVIGPLVLLGALQVAAGQSTAPATAIQSGHDGASTPDRSTYTRAMQDDMQQWQQKLHDFGEIARARGVQADNVAETNLNAAWDAMQTEARKLPAASAEGWASAKASYENASRGLADAWDRARH